MNFVEQRFGSAEAAAGEWISIGEMSRLYRVSLRTLRFYEDRGLLVPRRDGTARFYAVGDRGRLEMILQGKQLGFTLSEIADMLADGEQRPQTRRLAPKPERIAAQLEHLERQRGEIDAAIAQLRNVQRLMDGAGTEAR